MAGYVGNIPVPQGTQTRQSFTATASQTSFPTIGYTAGFIDVYLNGIKLVSGTDFTASNGSDVVLTTGAAVNDVLDVVIFDTFDTSSGTFSATTLKNDVTLKNDTEQDTDGGRASKIIYQGEQSGGEISTLAEIQASHDGTADDEKGDLIFRTNDGSDGTSPTTAMTIDSAQNVGIQKTPNTWRTTDVALQLGDSTSQYANLVSGGTGVTFGAGWYRDGVSNNFKYTHSSTTAGRYDYNYTANNAFTWHQAASGTAGNDITFTEIMRADEDGLKFNGDTAAANALDDYEEGTFTPSIGSSSGSGGAATSATGKYTKIGNMVFAQCHMSVNTLGSMSGTFFVTGFPFAAGSNYTLYQGAVRSQGIGGSNDKAVTFEMSAGTANGRFHFASGTSTQLTVAVSQLSAGDFFAIGITYNV